MKILALKFALFGFFGGGGKEKWSCEYGLLGFVPKQYKVRVKSCRGKMVKSVGKEQTMLVKEQFSNEGTLYLYSKP